MKCRPSFTPTLNAIADELELLAIIRARDGADPGEVGITLTVAGVTKESLEALAKLAVEPAKVKP